MLLGGAAIIGSPVLVARSRTRRRDVRVQPHGMRVGSGNAILNDTVND